MIERFLRSTPPGSFMIDLYRDLATLKRRKFESALRMLFTPWQIAILRKRAAGSPLTDAERQELSRRIKPKLLAIDTLQDLKLLHPFFD